jgi:glycosyltransferase involved in cell wall biosynthesis
MVHEAVMHTDAGDGFALRAMALVSQWMLPMLVRGSDIVYLSTPAWRTLVDRWARPGTVVEDLPVPSNIAVTVDALRVEQTRSRLRGGDDSVRLIGHFGTLRDPVGSLVLDLVGGILEGYPERRLVLVSSGAEGFLRRVAEKWPTLVGQVLPLGKAGPSEAAEAMCACDVMVQPYEDGVTSRRGSLVAAMALGCAVVTNDGEESEAKLGESGGFRLLPRYDTLLFAEAVGEILRGGGAEYAFAAKEYYQQNHSVERTVEILRRS